MAFYGKKYLLIVLVLFVVLTSCQNVNKTNVVKLGELSFTLRDGVSKEALVLKLSDYEDMLTQSRNGLISRGVSSDKVNLSLEELGAISEEIDKNYPNVDRFSEKDIEKIKTDFIGISDEQISKHSEKIKDIYTSQFRYELYKALENKNSNGLGFISRGKGKYWNTPLSKEEFWLLFKNPHRIVQTVLATNQAKNVTKSVFGENTWRDKTDAFRHAIWNIFIAKKNFGSKKTRLAWAKEFTDAHEVGEFAYVSKDRAKDKRDWDDPMDYHNNKIGRDYFDKHSKEISRWWWFWPSVDSPSDETIVRDIRKMAGAAVGFYNKEELKSLGGSLVFYKGR